MAAQDLKRHKASDRANAACTWPPMPAAQASDCVQVNPRHEYQCGYKPIHNTASNLKAFEAFSIQHKAITNSLGQTY
eukprot:2886098-Amphidinium_carterae.1